MTPLKRLLIATTAGCLLAVSLQTAVSAQSDQDRRIDRLEKEVRELRSILFQGRDTGQPVVVKPAGPDPAVDALQNRVDQQDQTVRALSGRMEVLGHDLEEARRQNAAAHDSETELRGEVKELSDQLAKFQPPPQPQPLAQNPPPAADPSAPPADFSAASPTAAAPVTEFGAFKAAKAKLAGGDFAGGGDAFTAYLTQYGTSPRAKEANYWLGESYYGRNLYSEATVAYARSLKDWPKSPWAPDATVKLARALVATSRQDQACAALGEFDKRYSTTAPKVVKARAAATASAAKCSRLRPRTVSLQIRSLNSF